MGGEGGGVTIVRGSQLRGYVDSLLLIDLVPFIDIYRQWIISGLTTLNFSACCLYSVVCDQIRITACQARLLMRSKLKQYIGLVAKAEVCVCV